MDARRWGAVSDTDISDGCLEGMDATYINGLLASPDICMSEKRQYKIRTTPFGLSLQLRGRENGKTLNGTSDSSALNVSGQVHNDRLPWRIITITKLLDGRFVWEESALGRDRVAAQNGFRDVRHSE